MPKINSENLRLSTPDDYYPEFPFSILGRLSAYALPPLSAMASQVLEAEILRRLYGRVVIPETVFRELQHSEPPATVSDWIARRPWWLEIERTTIPPDQALRLLGEGEREAIALAQQHGPDVLLLMDEGRGRREAQRRNLRITGTLGVLNDGAARGWVDLPSAIERLRQTTFRASPSLLQSLLDRDSKRKRES